MKGKPVLYDKVRYIGPMGLYQGVDVGDCGYIIEIFNDIDCEVEFSGADGVSVAVETIPFASLIAVE